jgi:transcriptional regulator with XRE-family HTH domain
MTPATDTPEKFVIGPSLRTRPQSTLSLTLLVQETQRLEMGHRIAALRERSPFTQPQVAEKLGIGLRAYQKLEARGTTKYERCEEIADLHAGWAADDPDWAHLNAAWIWGVGPVRSGETPDVIGALHGDANDAEADQLERIERLLVDLRDAVFSLVTRQPEGDEPDPFLDAVRDRGAELARERRTGPRAGRTDPLTPGRRATGA